MLPHTPPVLPRCSLDAPLLRPLAPPMLPLKRLCSLSQSKRVILNPKFGVYIIYIHPELMIEDCLFKSEKGSRADLEEALREQGAAGGSTEGARRSTQHRGAWIDWPRRVGSGWNFFGKVSGRVEKLDPSTRVGLTQFPVGSGRVGLEICSTRLGSGWKCGQPDFGSGRIQNVNPKPDPTISLSLNWLPCARLSA